MLERQKLEQTIIEIARQNGECVDRHTLYEVRNGIAQTLQEKERHRRRMNSPTYQKPVGRRRPALHFIDAGRLTNTQEDS